MTISLEALSYIATIVAGFGLPLAALTFVLDRRKERREHELETYASVAREYRDFLRLCLEYHHLQVYDYMPDLFVSLTPEQEHQKMIILDLLVSTMETAYFLYEDQSNPFKRRQWAGWEAYLRDWCGRPDFKAAWDVHIGSQYDERFMALMNSLFKAASDPKTAQPSAQADAP